jgi:alpha-ketoglutarate-dependent taurine dioxygenase
MTRSAPGRSPSMRPEEPSSSTSAAAIAAMLPGVRRARPFDFPLVLEPVAGELKDNQSAFIPWCRDNMNHLTQLLDHAGAVLFRGFASKHPDAFAAFATLLPAHKGRYAAGTTPRSAFDTNVYETTEVLAPYRICLHQEKSYMKDYPARIAFYCREAARRGGETIIGDMRRLLAELPPALVERFLAKRILYRRNFVANGEGVDAGFAPLKLLHRSWEEAFSTSDEVEVESLCRAAQADFEWQQDGSLTVAYLADAIITHPRSGARAWFNQAASLHMNERVLGQAFAEVQRHYADGKVLPYDIRYGDGSPLTLDDLLPVYEAMERVTVSRPWRQGDILLLDNISVAHGRNPYEGRRDVRVALFD